MKPIRDIYLDFVETVAEMEDDYAEVLAENLEYMGIHFTFIIIF